MGLAVAVVRTGDMSINFLPLTLDQEGPHPDVALIYWLRFNILVLIVRATTRGFIHWDVTRPRGEDAARGVVTMSNIEHQFDLSVWSGLMILSSWRLYHVLHEGVVQALVEQRGLSAGQGNVLAGLS